MRLLFDVLTFLYTILLSLQRCITNDSQRLKLQQCSCLSVVYACMSDQQDPELPPLLTYPSESIKGQLPPQEWESCLELWISSVELRLGLSNDRFSKASAQTLGIPFLVSYLSKHESRAHELVKGTSASRLDKLCYLLLKRIVSRPNDAVGSVGYFDMLSLGSVTYGQHNSWRKVLKSIWAKYPTKARKAIESAKSSLATSKSSRAQQDWLRKLSGLTRALPETATVTVAGADYLDTLNDIYKTVSDEIQRVVTANIFYSFAALLDTKHVTILTDNIYHLKSEADRLQKLNPSTTTIFSSLLCTTSFLRHFSSNEEVAARKQALIEQLSTYRQHMLHLHPLPPVQKKKKGKQRVREDDGMHMHKAAQISQVHELFPDLSTAYLMKALDHFSDDAEAVIAALLEPESLPDSLKDQDMSDVHVDFDVALPDLAPRSTPPLLPQRKSVFDNDEFDQLNISSKQLRRGKKDLNIDEVGEGDSRVKSKAAILAALAAFDSDDDERDDTYDVADIGGAVDNTVDSDERRTHDDNEEALFKAWKQTPELFSRDGKTRASNIRQQLKRETGMSDEQIEGWAIMLKRDPKMESRLQDKYSAVRAFGGNQRALESTKWQTSISTENSDVDSGPERSNDTRRMGQDGIRGHRDFGRGRGRGGGSTSGPSDAAATQAARRRKEQGGGRGGANHRRDARARKIGRGMGALPS